MKYLEPEIPSHMNMVYVYVPFRTELRFLDSHLIHFWIWISGANRMQNSILIWIQVELIKNYNVILWFLF